MGAKLIKRFLPILCCALASCSRAPQQSDVRVAVIGGMVMSGMWQQMAAAFTKETGIKITAVAVGPKEILDKAFRAGNVDLVTLHSSDTATNFVADGLGIDMRPWARNELVVVGPHEDPAGIRGMKSGMQALLKIAACKASFVEARNTGSQTIEIHLWREANFTPTGPWLIKDEAPTPQQVVEFASQHHAYVIVGHIPVLFGKMPSPGMDVMVQGDPDMQRPYVVIEANPANHPHANSQGAKLLADYLVSPRAQMQLQMLASKAPGGTPIFFPISPQSPK
jgi:tungstate transport system substrate-binding protein